ncbi:MAG: hypothetical protein J4400_04505 [Candidatus Aenigmarchaeota archaeon]|nr:hypothetical protein [Candidatus Aenigmarchaeota archaeon]
MEYIARVEYCRDGSSRILLPFGPGDGSIVAVRNMTRDATSMTLLYPGQWDNFFKKELSGSGKLHFNYASRQFEVHGHCVLLDRQFSDYLDADFVNVTNGRSIKIEPFTARKSGHAARRNVA